jgi:hypothetical protein
MEEKFWPKIMKNLVGVENQFSPKTVAKAIIDRICETERK